MTVAVRLLLALALAASITQTRGAPGATAVPNVIAAPLPDYPIEAFRRRLAGTAVVVLDIDPKTGKVGRVQLRQSTGIGLLDRLTIRAFTKWQFKPGTVTRVAIPMRFSPNGVELGASIDPDRAYPFQGTVQSADASAKTITVRGPRGTDVIGLNAETKVSRNGRPAGLQDATVGSVIRGTAKVTPEMRSLAVSLELE